MAEHTPLPWTCDGLDLWHFGEGYESKTDPHLYTGIGIGKALQDSPVAIANLALIRQRVNAHDKLVKACFAAKKLISQSSKIDWDDEVMPLLDDALEGLETSHD